MNDDLLSTAADLNKLADELEVMSDMLREQRRARRIAQGLPADPPPVDLDEVRARAAVLRAENDLAEARAILAATQRH